MTNPSPSESVTLIDQIAGSRITLTPHGLVIGETLTQDKWVALMERMRLAHSTYRCYLADLLAYGRKQFGDDYVDGRLQQLEFDLADVQHAEAIGRLSLDLRARHQLTSEHYFVLGRHFPDERTAQSEWAALSVEHSLSPLALKRSLEADGGPRLITDAALADLTGRHSGQPVIQGWSLIVKQWVSGIGGEEKLLRAPRPTREAFIRELRPVDELYQKVCDTLAT